MKKITLQLKKRSFLLFTLFIGHLALAQILDNTINDPGDIAFVAYHDNDDGFAFVFLDNCPSNTSIRFVDEGWNGTEFNSAASEGEVLWTNNTGNTINAGTVIVITDADDNTNGISASMGIASEIESGFTTGTANDQIFAITGTRSAPGVFLAYVGAALDGSNVITLVGTGLVSGQTAVFFEGEGVYTGSTVCNNSLTECAAMINTASNWSIGGFQFPGAQPSNFSGSAFSNNTAPTATAPSAPIVLEDAMNVAVADDIQIGDADGDDQTVSLTITGGTLTLGTAGITFGGSGNGTASFTAQGTLANINTALDAATFTPTTNLNGTNAGTISFTANDGLETSEAASVSFDITPVNDEPSFMVGANETVNEDAEVQIVSSWATNIDVGATNESGQTLTFSVSNDNNALFSSQPAINANGNLTYTPARDAFGMATVTVSLSDDGGTANGGDDTSTDQTFTITVNQVNDTAPVVTSISLDSGVSATDFITNDNTPSVIGTAEPGSTISLIIPNPFGPGIVDTFNFDVTVVADASGAFTIDYPIASAPVLSDGENDFQVVSRLNEVALTSEIISGTIDTTAPTIAITSSENSPTINNSFPITITFDQEVSGFVLADIAVGNGTASDLSTSDNITYTATVTATADGDVTVNVAANIANDIAGNANEAASQFSITYNDPALSIGDNTLSPTDFSFVNPVANELVIVSSKEITSIKIYNMGGAVVASSKGNRVSTGTLSSGLYMALIRTKSGTSTTVKIIKR